MNRKTIFITGASRGVGLEIAKRFARDNANIAIVAKTTEPSPKLKGTLWSARDEIIKCGANEVLAIACDVRDLAALKLAINQVGEKFGKIDAVINNASSIYLLKTSEVSEKQFDLMHNIIVRASLFTVQYALPYLKKSDNAHVLNLAPKPDLQSKWFKNHTAYTICKYSSAMMVMGLAAELKNDNIAVNALWPATLLDTAAVQNLLGGAAAVAQSRKPSIAADAAHFILNQSSSITGNYYLDEDIIRQANLDIEQYSVVPGSKLITDLYVEKHE